MDPFLFFFYYTAFTLLFHPCATCKKANVFYNLINAQIKIRSMNTCKHWYIFSFPIFLVVDDKLACFCNESLTGGLCYLILFGCENNNVLFTAAMGQIWPLCSKSTMIKAGWCITAGLCVCQVTKITAATSSQRTMSSCSEITKGGCLQPLCPITATWSVLLQLRRRHRVLTQLLKHLAFWKQEKMSALVHWLIA